MYTSFDAHKCLVPKCHSILQVKVAVLQTILSVTRSNDVPISTEATTEKLAEIRRKYYRIAQEVRNANSETPCSVGWSVTQQLWCLSCHAWYGSVLICPPMETGRIHLRVLNIYNKPTCTQSSSHVTLISVELYNSYVLMYTSFDALKYLVPKCHSILQVKVAVFQTILSVTRSNDVPISTEATREKLAEVRTKH